MPDLHNTLAQLDAMPCPKGVSAETWSELKAAMRAALAGKAASALALSPPISAGAQARLTYDDAAGLIRWGYYCPGDYDQNSEVRLPDLVPLAVHFGESTGTGAPFPQDAIQAVVDGDRNGEITLSDIVPLAANFGARVQGYRVYRADSLNSLPSAPDRPNNPGALLSREVAFAEAVGEAAAARKQFSSPVDAWEIAQYYWVRPYEGALEGTPSDACWVPGTGGTNNYPPVADIKATPTEGDAPLTVELDASGSTDADDAIAKYEWDWNGVVGGLNFFSSGGDPVVEHTYNAAVTYTPMVRVTDARGASDVATTEIVVRVPGVNKAPQANLIVTPNSGATMLKVEWDASGSIDTDGHVVDYSWDFDGDGYFEYDSGLTAKLPYYYYASGNFSAIVQVTDDDGAASFASAGVSVSEAQKWHITEVTDHMGTEQCPAGSEVYMLLVEGNPALCYWKAVLPDPPENAWLVYQRASDPEGTSWHASVQLEYAESGFPRALFLLGGRPSVLKFPGDSSTQQVSLRRAQDALGAAWLPPEDMPFYADAGSPVILSGLPGICFSGRPAALGALDGIYILLATDDAGSSWGEPWRASPNLPVELCWTMVAGKPAVACHSRSSMLFLRAKDPAGASWLPTNALEPELNESDSVSNPALLIDAAGMPAISWHDGRLSQEKYCRALDVDGRQWGGSQVLAVEAGRPLALIVADGRPGVLFMMNDTSELRFLASNDAEGAHWGLPVTVDVDACFGVMQQSVALLEFAGRLAVAYTSSIGETGSSAQLRFAMYY